MYMEKKGYGHRISIPQCIDTLFQKKKKKEGQRHHEDQRFKIIIKYVVNGIVINIIKNVHNLFAILFQRNPKALKHIDLPQCSDLHHSSPCHHQLRRELRRDQRLLEQVLLHLGVAAALCFEKRPSFRRKK